MFSKLPKPVETYFKATNNPDPAVFLSAFAKDAVLEDEGKKHYGIQAIKEWSDIQHFAAQITLEPVNVMQDGDNIVVTAKVDGNFDRTGLPDPVLLDFHFTVRNDKIAGLTILLTQ